MSDDPFGRALRDHHLGTRSEPLLQRAGNEFLEHPIEAFYFGEFDPSSDRGAFRERWLDGPLLDMGAGVGRDALYFQDEFEVVAIEVSEHLVETMRDRGVEDARKADMFELEGTFPPDRFGSALAYGTQIGLAGSMDGLRRFLRELATVTTEEATAVIDSYDPAHEDTPELLGFRERDEPGLARREMWFEYEGQVGQRLQFRLFGPNRLRESAETTPWEVVEIEGGSDTPHYLAALEKR